MTQLAQAYIHLRPYEISRERLQRLGRSTDRIAYEAALRVYGRTVTVDVTLEEASLKGRVTVLGALLVGYGVIADYKGFKESIGELCKDAREYAVDVCGEIVKEARATKNQVYRTERRLKTPGKLDRLIARLERLNSAGERLSRADYQKELDSIRHEWQLIERDLSQNEVALVAKALAFENLPPLTQLPKRVPRKEMPPVAIRSEREMADLFSQNMVPLDSKTAKPPGGKQLKYHNAFVVSVDEGEAERTPKGRDDQARHLPHQGKDIG
jgi:hypothetical protein